MVVPSLRIVNPLAVLHRNPEPAASVVFVLDIAQAGYPGGVVLWVIDGVGIQIDLCGGHRALAGVDGQAVYTRVVDIRCCGQDSDCLCDDVVVFGGFGDLVVGVDLCSQKIAAGL